MTTNQDSNCQNCKEAIHTPDEKTGLIHKSGLYACHILVDGKDKRLETVAE